MLLFSSSPDNIGSPGSLCTDICHSEEYRVNVCSMQLLAYLPQHRHDGRKQEPVDWSYLRILPEVSRKLFTDSDAVIW